MGLASANSHLIQVDDNMPGFLAAPSLLILVLVSGTTEARAPKYDGIYVGGVRSNGVVIVRPWGDDGYSLDFDGHFGLSAGGGPHGGSVKGVALRSGKSFLFRPGIPQMVESECTLTVKFTPQAVIVSEEKACAEYHGTAATFEGRYKKVFAFPKIPATQFAICYGEDDPRNKPLNDPLCK